MDFFKLIKSLDELVYEVLSWMLFYPITLWRTIRHPVQSMIDAERELNEAEEKRFRQTLGPPLFLFLTLVLIHIAELIFHQGGGDDVIRRTSGLARFITDDTTLLILRVILFGLLPLTAARRLLKIRGQVLDREHLRAPFYAQCYVCAIYALLINASSFAGGLKIDLSTKIALVASLVFLAVAWLLTVEARWFAVKQEQSTLRGFGNALVVFLEWLGVGLLVALTLI